MALRWKIPELNADLVDPQGIRAAQQYAASQRIVPVASRSPENPYLPADGSLAEMNRNSMEGYRPNSAMTPDGTGMNGYFNTQAAVPQGYRPNVADPQGVRGQQPVDMEGYGASRQAASDRAQIQGRIAELETELASVTNKIAEIDKATPGLAKNPKEWEIAAKRAEIGDMSAYDNLVSRGNQSSSSVSNIESGLYAAAKELWGLKDADDSQRNMSQNIIGVELQKAEDWARKNGVNIETGMPRIYYDLRQEYNRLGGNGGPAPAGPAADGARINFENARTVGNEVASLVAKKDLHDSDIKDMEDWVAANPNSPHSSEIRTLIKDNKFKTEEAKARYQKTKADSDALFNQAKDLSTDGLRKWWEGLTSKQMEVFKKHHSIDLSKGTVQ